MGPKKKEEAPPPEPEELLPKGYSVGCEVYWTACATCLGDHGGVVKTGWKGMLVAVPGILTHEDEEGEKTYSLEEVEVQWPWPFEASRVPLTSLGLKQPPLAAMWNLKPSFGSKSIELTPFASSSLGSTSPSGKTCNGTMADMKARATGPFMEAIFKLQSYPCRSDKVEDLLEPALVEYLNSEEVAAGSTSFGLHTGHEGYVDWRAIFKWVSEVVTGANLYAKLSPELCLDEETYPSIVRRFDRQGGRFISDCPKSENILPFAKFVVTLLYLELKEADRLRAEREQQLKEVLEAEAPQDGDPRASVLWDTEDIQTSGRCYTVVNVAVQTLLQSKRMELNRLTLDVQWKVHGFLFMSQRQQARMLCCAHPLATTKCGCRCLLDARKIRATGLAKS
eukprot:TRINITY_DN22649_c0_g1_i1.p1 TRINITY_DN22649_c0_g1~~TRINITY_DN22649_c0_g1_i1.p1  ORF type:complete len:394 (+),score=67.35 TRINITY_DN22649_c0_g1_i1:86-1267(+)